MNKQKEERMLNSTTFCLQWLTLEWRNSSPAYCFYFQCFHNNTSFSSDWGLVLTPGHCIEKAHFDLCIKYFYHHQIQVNTLKQHPSECREVEVMNQSRHKDTQSLRKFNRKKRHDYFLLKEFLNAVVAQIMENFMEESNVAISFFFLHWAYPGCQRLF